MKNVLDNLPHAFTHTCPECERPARCDLEAGKSVCWCFSLPASGDNRWAFSEGQRCLCRSCLHKALAALATPAAVSQPAAASPESP
ncbi:cysteine-rich CWC family protein [Hahella sp. SMD15-11]|uniref:Cysteine-rich CWC family protein n=1 Tax=Thermohahella caldifontis TaxID=3142973 RepID=A0AB39US18_9GAMM